MDPNTSKVQYKKNRHGYESWEISSSEEENKYEFDTLSDYESDNSDAFQVPVTLHVESVHEKKKPFECEICDYSCSKKSNMTRHVVSIHEKQELLKCEIIQKLEKNKKNNLELQANPSVLKIDSKVIPVDKRQSIKNRKSILAEKGIKGHKSNEKENPNNGRIKSPLNCEKFNNVQNSKSEKEKPTKVDKDANLKKNQILNDLLLDKNHRKSFAVLMSEVVELGGEFFCPENCGKSFRKKTHLPKVIY